MRCRRSHAQHVDRSGRGHLAAYLDQRFVQALPILLFGLLPAPLVQLDKMSPIQRERRHRENRDHGQRKQAALHWEDLLSTASIRRAAPQFASDGKQQTSNPKRTALHPRTCLATQAHVSWDQAFWAEKALRRGLSRHLTPPHHPPTNSSHTVTP